MRAAVVVLLALLALAGCGGDEEAAPPVEDLADLETLRSDFDEHAGKTRVVLLFAPT